MNNGSSPAGNRRIKCNHWSVRTQSHPSTPQGGAACQCGIHRLCLAGTMHVIYRRQSTGRYFHQQPLLPVGLWAFTPRKITPFMVQHALYSDTYSATTEDRLSPNNRRVNRQDYRVSGPLVTSLKYNLYDFEPRKPLAYIALGNLKFNTISETTSCFP